MDALVRLDEARAMRTAKPCGPGLPTLRSSSQDGDVGSSGPTRRPCGRRWLSKPGHRGELGISRKPSRRECRLLRPCLWLLPPAYFVAGGPWVRPASGIPCALLLSRAAASCITRAFRAAGIFFHVFSVTMPRFMRGIPETSRGYDCRLWNTGSPGRALRDSHISSEPPSVQHGFE
jgi:hypothetical protein